jgi:ABC-type glutathione transport system ATPase component
MFNIQLNRISIIESGTTTTLIDNCFLNIESGKTYILLGSNGSGKTTLAMALTGLLNKDMYKVEGSVLYNGADLLTCCTEKLSEIRKQEIKYVFQDPVHSFNPLKKFGYYFEYVNSPVNEINDLLNYFFLPTLDVLKELLPHEVSVGMAQRIALSLAFIAKPKLIIMDEPNSALDLAASNLLFHKVKESTSNGSSVLIITQDTIFTEKIGDEIAILKNRIVSLKEKANDFLK